jgi:hypothetical protein
MAHRSAMGARFVVLARREGTKGSDPPDLVCSRSSGNDIRDALPVAGGSSVDALAVDGLAEWPMGGLLDPTPPHPAPPELPTMLTLTRPSRAA